jgi:hypothetical protein
MKTRLAIAFAVMVLCTMVAPRAYAQDIPTGEVQLGKSFIEPAYDDMTGDMIFLLTPLGAPFPVNANHHAVSPLYLIVYPTSAGGFVGTMNCMHPGGDNCPDHGPEIAGAAAAIMPAVYGQGVWGHDHLVDAPAAASSTLPGRSTCSSSRTRPPRTRTSPQRSRWMRRWRPETWLTRFRVSRSSTATSCRQGRSIAARLCAGRLSLGRRWAMAMGR